MRSLHPFLAFLFTFLPEAWAGQDAATEWSVQREWSGQDSETVETDQFMTDGRLFRIAWTATDLTPRTGGVLDVYVRNAGGELVAVGANLQNTGTFEVSSESDAHYLEISTARVSWRVAVEQPASAH